MLQSRLDLLEQLAALDGVLDGILGAGFSEAVLGIYRFGADAADGPQLDVGDLNAVSRRPRGMP
ncbi:MAG: hypothetical protein IT485_01820 [Gammaproteobacteria bacterium]|nr:hypothetical protein [Gammaproteobacteria bacterium]